MIGKIKDTLTVKYLCVKERVKSHFVNLWKRGRNGSCGSYINYGCSYSSCNYFQKADFRPCQFNSFKDVKSG